MDYKERVETEKLGFVTSWSTKEALITHFQQLLRQSVPKIYDRKTIEEMKSFTWNNEASMQGASASRGFHDDDIMSTLLAFWDLSPRRVEMMKVAKAHVPTKKKFQYSWHIFQCYNFYMAKKKKDEEKEVEKEEVLEPVKPGFDPDLPLKKQREFL